MLSLESISAFVFLWLENDHACMHDSSSPPHYAVSVRTNNVRFLLSFLLDIQATVIEHSICWHLSCTCLEFFCHPLLFRLVIWLIYINLFFFYFSCNLVHSWGTCCFIYVLPNQSQAWKLQVFVVVFHV